MLFATSFLPESARLAYALTTMLAFRAAYALYDVPQNAMLSLGTLDPEGRARVAALRLVLSGCAAVAVAAAMAAIIAFVDPAAHRLAFAGCALLFAPIAVLTALALERESRPFRSHAASLHEERTEPWTATLSLPRLLAAMLLVSMATATFIKLEPYYVAAIASQAPGAGTLMIAVSFGLLLSQPIWLRLSGEGLYGGIEAPLLLLLVALLAMGLLAPLGSAAQLGGALLFGFANGGIGMRVWAAYSNSVCARAAGSEALAFGLLSGTSKLGISASAAMAGGAIILAGQSDDRAANLLLAMIALPFPCVIAAVLCCARSPRVSESVCRPSRSIVKCQ